MAAVAVATPDFSVGQAEALEFMKEHFSGRLNGRSMGVLEKVLSHPGVQKRYFALDGGLHTLVDEDPDVRINRFSNHAVSLSVKAARSALELSGTAIDEVSGLVINTCTGYVCPGISSYVAEELMLPADTHTFDMVGSGCGGALPNMYMSRSMAQSAAKGAVISISVEISSAAFQMENDTGLLVSNALFGDGAAASVWRAGDSCLSMIDFNSILAPEFREHIRFVHRKGQLHNQLSMQLPGLVARPVGELVRSLLLRNKLNISDINHWAIHPGGEKIINAVKNELSLNDQQLSATRAILAEYGNMSSPSVMFIIERILKSGLMHEGDLCLMLAFGAGFSAYACLLRCGSAFPARYS
jgi:predicted naringenin-chalcone synthase